MTYHYACHLRGLGMTARGYRPTSTRDQIDAATTAAYQPGLDADPSMPPASLFVRPSEWAEFSEPIARPDSQA